MGELGVVTITDGGTNWAALFQKIFPPLVFGQPVHRITSFEEALALAALVHEVSGITFLFVLLTVLTASVQEMQRMGLLEGGSHDARPCTKLLLRRKP